MPNILLLNSLGDSPEPPDAKTLAQRQQSLEVALGRNTLSLYDAVCDSESGPDFAFVRDVAERLERGDEEVMLLMSGGHGCGKDMAFESVVNSVAALVHKHAVAIASREGCVRFKRVVSQVAHAANPTPGVYSLITPQVSVLAAPLPEGGSPASTRLLSPPLNASLPPVRSPLTPGVLAEATVDGDMTVIDLALQVPSKRRAGSAAAEENDVTTTGRDAPVLMFTGKEDSWVILPHDADVPLGKLLDDGVVFDLWLKKHAADPSAAQAPLLHVVQKGRPAAEGACELLMELVRYEEVDALGLRLYIADGAGRTYEGNVAASCLVDGQWHRLQWLLALRKGEVLFYVDEQKVHITEAASNHIPHDFGGWDEQWRMGPGFCGDVTEFSVWRPEEVQGHRSLPQLTAVVYHRPLNGKDRFVEAPSPVYRLTDDFPQACVWFNGINAYANIGHVGHLGSSSGALCVKLWCRVRRTQRRMSLLGVTDNSGQGFGVELNIGRNGHASPASVLCWVRDALGATCSVHLECDVLFDGEWHLLEFTLLNFEECIVSLTVDAHRAEDSLTATDGMLHDDDGNEVVFDGHAKFSNFTRYVSLAAHNLRGQICHHFEGSIREVSLRQSITQHVFAHFTIDEGPGARMLRDTSEAKGSGLLFMGLDRGSNWVRDDDFFKLTWRSSSLNIKRTETKPDLANDALKRVTVAALLFCVSENGYRVHDVLNDQQFDDDGTANLEAAAFVACPDVLQFPAYISECVRALVGAQRDVDGKKEEGVVAALLHIRLGDSSLFAVDLAAEHAPPDTLGGLVGRKSLTAIEDRMDRLRGHSPHGGVPRRSLASLGSVVSNGSLSDMSAAARATHFVNRTLRLYQTALAEVGLLPQAVKRCCRLGRDNSAEMILHKTFAQPRCGLFTHTYASIMHPLRRSSVFAVSVLSRYPSSLETISCGALSNALKAKTRYWAARVVQKMLLHHIAGKRETLKAKGQLAQLKLRKVEQERNPELSRAKDRKVALLITMDDPQGKGVPTCRTSGDVEKLRPALEHIGFEVQVYRNERRKDILSALERLNNEETFVFVYVSCYAVTAPLWYTPPPLEDLVEWEAEQRAVIAAEQTGTRMALTHIVSNVGSSQAASPAPTPTAKGRRKSTAKNIDALRRILPALNENEFSPKAGNATAASPDALVRRVSVSGSRPRNALPKIKSGTSLVNEVRNTVVTSRRQSVADMAMKSPNARAVIVIDDDGGSHSPGRHSLRPGRLPRVGSNGSNMSPSPRRAEVPVPALHRFESPSVSPRPRTKRSGSVSSVSPRPDTPTSAKSVCADAGVVYLCCAGDCPTEYARTDLIAFKDIRTLVCGTTSTMGRHSVLCVDCAALCEDTGFGAIHASSQQSLTLPYPARHQGGLLSHLLIDGFFNGAYEGTGVSFDTMAEYMQRVAGHMGISPVVEDGAYVGELSFGEVPPPAGRLMRVRPEGALHVEFKGSAPIPHDTIERALHKIFETVDMELEADRSTHALRSAVVANARVFASTAKVQDRSFTLKRVTYLPRITVVFGGVSCEEGWRVVAQRAAAAGRPGAEWVQFVEELVDPIQFPHDWHFEPAEGLGFAVVIELHGDQVFPLVDTIRGDVERGLMCGGFKATDILYYAEVTIEAERVPFKTLRVLHRKGELPTQPIPHVNLDLRILHIADE